MKKLLFATTALIATAGMASAEIKFSGYGRFGLKSSETEGTTNDFAGQDAKSMIEAATKAKTGSDAAAEAASAVEAAAEAAKLQAEHAAEAAKLQAEHAAEAAKFQAEQAAEAAKFQAEQAAEAAREAAEQAATDAKDNSLAIANEEAKRLNHQSYHHALAVLDADRATLSANEAADAASDAATASDADAAAQAAREAAEAAEAAARAGDAAAALADDADAAAAAVAAAQAAREAVADLADASGAAAIAAAAADAAAAAIAVQNAVADINGGILDASNIHDVKNTKEMVDGAVDVVANAAIDQAEATAEAAEAAANEAVEDANEAADEAVEDANEAADEAVEDANEAADEAVEDARLAETDANIAADAALSAAQSALNNRLLAGLGAGSDSDDTDVTSRYRVNMDIIQETNNGTKFEGRVRLQGDNGGSATLNAPRFSVSHGGLRLDVGNIAGAIDNLSGYYGNEPGLTALVGQYSGVNFAIDGYSSTGNGEGNAVAASFAIGDFSTQISYSDDGAGSEYGDVFGDSEQLAINAAWGMNDVLTFAVGYAQASQDLESGLAAAASGLGLTTPDSYDSDMYVMSAQADLGDLGLTVLFGSEDHDADPDGMYFDTFYGLSASYQIGAATNLTFAYGDGSAEFDSQQLGLGVAHDLGGATLKAGISQSKIDGEMNGMRLDTKTTSADFGVTFNF